MEIDQAVHGCSDHQVQQRRLRHPAGLRALPMGLQQTAWFLATNPRQNLCLVNGLMRVGTGSTHINPCLVQKVFGLGWFRVTIFLENAGSGGSLKTTGPLRPSSSPPRLSPALSSPRTTPAQGRLFFGHRTPPSRAAPSTVPAPSWASTGDKHRNTF
jgi:hypothetical protein